MTAGLYGRLSGSVFEAQAPRPRPGTQAVEMPARGQPFGLPTGLGRPLRARPHSHRLDDWLLENGRAHSVAGFHLIAGGRFWLIGTLQIGVHNKKADCSIAPTNQMVSVLAHCAC
jgi:hypothetical protein